MKVLEDTIIFRTHEKYLQIPIGNILFCKSDGNYITIYLDNGTKSTVCATIRSLGECLSKDSFLRIHHSLLVNKNKILSFSSKHHTVSVGNNNFIISKRKFRFVILELLKRRIPDVKLNTQL